MIESFIHDFMFTCDSLPSHLCPHGCEIKQNSWVSRVISLGARPAPLCPGARPCMLCHGDRLSWLSVQQSCWRSQEALPGHQHPKAQPSCPTVTIPGEQQCQGRAVNVAGQQSRLSKHMLSCSRPWSLGDSWDIKAWTQGQPAAVTWQGGELKPPPSVFRHPLDSAGSSLCASRVT